MRRMLRRGAWPNSSFFWKVLGSPAEALGQDAELLCLEGAGRRLHASGGRGGGGRQPRARVVAASAGSWPRCCRPAAGQLVQKPSQSNLVPRAPGRGSCPRPSDPLAVPDLQAQAQGPSSQAPPPRGEPVSTAGCRPCPCPCPAQAERCCPHGWSRVQLCSGMEPGWGGGRGGEQQDVPQGPAHTRSWGTVGDREVERASDADAFN